MPYGWGNTVDERVGNMAEEALELQLKQARKTLGVSQVDFAKLAGISPVLIYWTERGARPSPKIRARIVLGLQRAADARMETITKLRASSIFQPTPAVKAG